MSEVAENLHAWAEVDHDAGRFERSKDMNAAAVYIEKLHEALREALIENMQFAYETGIETGGQWTHAFMSDGEQLVSELGMDPTQGYYDPKEVREAIPAAADRMIRDLSEAEEG